MKNGEFLPGGCSLHPVSMRRDRIIPSHARLTLPTTMVIKSLSVQPNSESYLNGRKTVFRIISLWFIISEGLYNAVGRPQALWLRQMESNLRDMRMAALVSAWAMARRRQREYRRKVGA